MLALAGGAGVASQSGTIYFLSPEKLAGASDGIQDQPNLYVVQPGGAPQFVATIDSSLTKPPPIPPKHPANPGFITGLTSPEGITVDQETGDIYVIERGEIFSNGDDQILRFNSSGAGKLFSAGPGAGSNRISQPGLNYFYFGGGIAVDNSPGSPIAGAFYVRSGFGTVAVYARSGAKLGEIEGFGGVCGVAVDQSDGTLYVGDGEAGDIRRLTPSSLAPPIDNSDYVETRLNTEPTYPCHVSADTAGNVYGLDAFSGGSLMKWNASDFKAVPDTKAGTPVGPPSALWGATDPENDDLYVSEGGGVARYDSSGALIEKFGEGSGITSGIAVNGKTGRVYAVKPSTFGATIVEFGRETFPYQPIDNPAVLHATSQAETHNYGDFQVTPDGSYAAFTSRQPLTGFDNSPLQYSEVFRYAPAHSELVCASCNPTSARAAGSSTLSQQGLGLADDGRVFFDSADPIAPRDLNGKVDAYEYDQKTDAGEKIELISTGVSVFDSRLLGISADATDALFFTRDVLVPQDKNGERVKLYDARADGGFEYFPPEVPCKASDECHGAGTEAPAPPPIRTIKGSKGNDTTTTKKKGCRRGRVKRRGRCVKRGKTHSHQRHKKPNATRGNG